ncbi:lytic murein transglycosylase [Desulfomarina sp.]
MTVIIIAFACVTCLLAENVKADPGFQSWISDFYRTASRNGIKRKTYEQAFSGVTEIDQVVLEKARYQPEFTTSIWDYIDGRVNPLTIRKGKRMGRYYAGTLESVENRFGVESSILLAIWSMESSYGEVLKKKNRLHYIPRALATLAYGDKKRRRFAEKQLIAALQILQDGDISREQFLGSWAGAMGHTQFIPTSYLAYGIDMDGNGRRDIWNSIPDALATAASLLRKNGWRTGKTWGYETVVPPGGYQFKDQTRSLAQWEKLGFIRPGKKKYPRPGDRAVLKFFAGGDGPAFLMLKNFFVLKRYNNADAYALAVGLLADRLAGSDGMVQSWPRMEGALDIGEKIELQERLKKLGYYAGEIDGALGRESKKAIRRFQVEAGIKADGVPRKELLRKLREKF